MPGAMLYRSSGLKKRIKECGEEAHGQNNSFNDKPERSALRKFLANSLEFQQFWAQYFGTQPNVFLNDDPYGPYKVDVGLYAETTVPIGGYPMTSKIIGLIEVDVFNSWGNTFPSHYRKFHVLERKLKYFKDTSHKYLTCTFNKFHNQMCCTTRDNIERCIDKYGIEDKWMSKINEYDRVIRCPLDSNIKWFTLP